MSENLNRYLTIESINGEEYESFIIAPNDSIALEFFNDNRRGELVSIFRCDEEVYILDYENREDEDNHKFEVKYTVGESLFVKRKRESK